MKAIAEVYTECQFDKAERFLKKLVTGLAPRSKKQGFEVLNKHSIMAFCCFFLYENQF